MSTWYKSHLPLAFRRMRNLPLTTHIFYSIWASLGTILLINNTHILYQSRSTLRRWNEAVLTLHTPSHATRTSLCSPRASCAACHPTRTTIVNHFQSFSPRNRHGCCRSAEPKKVPRGTPPHAASKGLVFHLTHRGRCHPHTLHAHAPHVPHTHAFLMPNKRPCSMAIVHRHQHGHWRPSTTVIIGPRLVTVFYYLRHRQWWTSSTFHRRHHRPPSPITTTTVSGHLQPLLPSPATSTFVTQSSATFVHHFWYSLWLPLANTSSCRYCHQLPSSPSSPSSLATISSYRLPLAQHIVHFCLTHTGCRVSASQLTNSTYRVNPASHGRVNSKKGRHAEPTRHELTHSEKKNCQLFFFPNSEA